MKIKLSFWPAGIVLMLAGFFCGIMTLVFIASAHQTELVSDNYYEQEIRYQQRIDGLARAREAGAAITHDAARGRVIIFPGRDGAVPDAPARLQLYRPSAASQDREIPLLPQPDGSLAADVAALQRGPWQARVSWSVAGRQFVLETSFTNTTASAASATNR